MEIIRMGGEYHTARIVPAPKGDKSATEYVFGAPYRRVRKDSLGHYVLMGGECIPVAIRTLQA